MPSSGVEILDSEGADRLRSRLHGAADEVPRAAQGAR